MKCPLATNLFSLGLRYHTATCKAQTSVPIVHISYSQTTQGT